MFYSKITRWPILLILILIVTTAPRADEARLSPDAVKAWREDIDYLHQHLERRHINLYHRISKEEFAAELHQIKQRLPELNPSQVPLELMRLFKKIGDGHTQFAYWGHTHHRFPLTLEVFDEQLYVTAAPPAYEHLLGMRLHKINNQSTIEIIDQLKLILQSVENTYSEMQRLAETITVAEVLKGADIISDSRQAKFGFIDEAGIEYSINLSSQNAGANPRLTELRAPLPAGFVKHRAALNGVDLYLNKTSRVALINFDSYPHTGMTAFAEKLCGIFSDADISNVVIDLRRNGGGDFFVGLTLAWGLVLCDELDWNTGMYVLIGRATFSAAMSNAVQYRQILNATLVGEPTGANPAGYQDAGTFALPNSGWVVMYSKRRYRFQDISTEGVQPDIFIKPDLASLKRGRDLQLDWIMENIRINRVNRQ